MIGTKYKTFGVQRGFKVSNGICYGILNGFVVTLSEGSGFKDMYISACVDQEAYDRIMADAKDLKKKYKLNALEVTEKYILIRFVDAIGTIKRVESFTNEAMPMLGNYGVKGADVCPHCKQALDSSTSVTKLILYNAIKLHAGCAEEILNEMREEEEKIATKQSNAGMGMVGAMLFGLVAAIPWAIVYALGWFVGWLGALIGLAVVKGYEKFGGNIKKSIIPVFAIIIIVCVIFGQFLGENLDLIFYCKKEEIPFVLSEIPTAIIDTFKSDSEYRTAILGNIIMGLIFGGLGVIGVFRGLISKVSSHSKKIIDLENV